MITRRTALLAGLVAASATRAPADVGVVDPWEAMKSQGLYLPTLRSLQEKAEKDIKVGGQMLAQWLAIVGDEPGAFAAMVASNRAWSEGRPPRPATVDLAGARTTDALEAVAAAAKGRRIIILNEAHHVSACRSFASDVARALRAEGFNWLAAEAFATHPEQRFAERVNGGEPITTDLGYYLCDPVLADLVREARAAGFTLAAYEQRTNQEAAPDADRMARIGAREDAQVTNLIADVLDNDPRARLLVYCGYSHAAKAPLGDLAWMAARLKAKTGIDPLCIEQSAGVAGADTDMNTRAIVEHLTPSRPLAAFQADGAPLTARYPGAVDLAVYHPPRAKSKAGQAG